MQRRRIIAAALAGGLAGMSRAIAAAPSPGSVALTRIGFGSCADQRDPQPIWDAVFAAAPQLFVMMGDNVYGDSFSAELGPLRRAYAAADRIPGFARLKRTLPVLAIWDDHDYGRNDAGAGFPWKDQSKALFCDFWDVPADDPRRSRPGLYHARIFGPPGRRVQVILLDTRWFRDPLRRTDQRGAAGRERYLPDDDPGKTMLGAAQWAWLETQLRQPAELRLLVSSIQVLAEGHGWERWGNLPRERQRLFDLIGRTGAQGVVFVSGDRHLGALYQETDRTPYALVEMTSSGLTKSYRSGEPGPNRLGAPYGEINFGLVDIDWAAGRVHLSIRGADGAPARSVARDLATLRAG
jgi:alkaline phosphatase D